jgi:hypothetical protein
MDTVEEVLAHFGVKGMKWGVRGSRPDMSSPEHKQAKALSKKRTSELTNEELQALITRKNLEKQHTQLSPETKKLVASIITDILREFGGSILKKSSA